MKYFFLFVLLILSLENTDAQSSDSSRFTLDSSFNIQARPRYSFKQLYVPGALIADGMATFLIRKKA